MMMMMMMIYSITKTTKMQRCSKDRVKPSKMKVQSSRPTCKNGSYHCRRRRHSWHATLKLCSAIRRHHPPHKAVLSHTCCFGERKVVLFQILLDGTERGRPRCLLQSAGGDANRILLASALSSMRIICSTG